MFNEDHLPAWAQQHPLQPNPALFAAPQVDLGELERLGDEFRKACKDFEEKSVASKPTAMPSNMKYTFEEKPEPLAVPEKYHVVPYQFKKYSDIR